MLDLDYDFKEFFPSFNFRLSDIQKRVIGNVVAGNNTLCIMPTGQGKSVIYWMAAAELKGITIVVSPLTALIAEQAQNLRNHGYNAIEFHGGIDVQKQQELLISIATRQLTPDYVFLSPEKIATDGFLEFCLRSRKEDIKLIVIDEVHCVSQWGLSFRPFYMRIPDFLNSLFGDENWCRVLALTATLNPKELGDISSYFRIEKNDIIKQDLLLRSEIQLHVMKFVDEKEKEGKFWSILQTHRGEKTLVYVYRKYGTRSVETLCQDAVDKGYKADYFHGDMTAAERMRIVERYRNSDVDVIFATNAFGMGIDIKDIRVVIHYMIPESAEQYYQEIGRAARDRGGANAYLLYSNKNIEVKRTHFIDRSFPDECKLKRVYQKIAKKTGLRTQPYFEDEELQECLPYYLEAGLIEIVGKGFSDIAGLTDITDPKVNRYYSSTTTKAFCGTMKKCGMTAKQLSEDVYSALVRGTAKAKKPLSRWLVLDIKAVDINDAAMALMLDKIEEKRKYKHDLLDYFVYTIENNPDNQSLHQEIALYLGMDKHQLGRIHETADGNHVRSKSEVIICNLLHEHGIQYQYEEKLYYSPGKWIEPDFTILLPSGEKWFWEHVGLLGNDSYDANWLKKLEIYDTYFQGKLIRTYESGALSRDAYFIVEKIETIKKSIVAKTDNN
ncbi:MAG: ATP-dependent DNA helicase RecQ [Acidaminococcaceae bacterium]|nr:ATP-dependent DNA helicase RecQ [Acidaminococcaceae bacterium]